MLTLQSTTCKQCSVKIIIAFKVKNNSLSVKYLYELINIVTLAIKCAFYNDTALFITEL